MKSLTAILLASLCLFAHATSVFETPAFVELKKEPFGLTLTSLVQINMSAKQSGRLDAINEVLQTVAESLTTQSTTNEETIQAQRGWCDDQVNTLTGKLQTAESDLANYQSEDADLSNEKVSEESALANEEQDLATNKDNQASAEQALVDENARNDQAVKEYADAIAACEQSLTLLKSITTGNSSFAQIKSRFSNVASLLQKHLANKSSPLITPVISILAELATSSQEVDQDKLAKIVSLISQLLDELRSQEAENVVRHSNTVAELTQQIESLATLISQNESAIAQHTERLNAIADRQSQLVSIIGDLQALIPVLQAQLDQTNDTCTGYEVHYANVKTVLDSQTATLEKVREYFNLHIVTSVENIEDGVYHDQLSA